LVAPATVDDDVLLLFEPPHVHLEPRVPETEPLSDLTLREERRKS
jgi:hypothetical protein